MIKKQQSLAAWIEIFCQLGEKGPPNRDALAAILSEDVRFVDPFNDIRGHAAVHRLLEHTAKQVRNLHFQILDQAHSEQASYLKWRMQGRVAVIGDWQVSGMSELLFDGQGLILSHQDYWDAAEQFYGHLPIIGWQLRRLRRMASV